MKPEDEKRFNRLLMAIYYDDVVKTVNNLGLIAKASECPALIEAHKTLRNYLKLVNDALKIE